MTRVAWIVLAVACAACKGGGESESPPAEPVTAPALTGFYRVDAADTGDGMKSMDALFRSSIENDGPDAPEFVWHRLGVQLDADSMSVQSSYVVRGRDEAYPFASCTATATVPVVWHGASVEVANDVVAESRFSVFNGDGGSIADSCRVNVTATRITVERTDERIELVSNEGRVVLVADDRDPKPETRVRRAAE